MQERPPFSTSLKYLMVLTRIYMVLHNSHNSSVVHRSEASKIVLWGHRPGHTWTNSHLFVHQSQDFGCLTNEVVHTCSTIGSNVEEIVLQKTRFLMWDLGGQEVLRSSWDTYYSSTEFVILVIDSTDRNRLLTTREELYKMLAHEALQDASVLIFANKQDVKDSMSTAEISQSLTLSAIKDHPWHIQGCCALTGEGLPAGLQWMQSQATAN
uniref:putative ADP-ribosylation factor-like protein 5C isoform X3 n=1 Tax=Myodes glareolus TaxID=447135 RepID=UPI0020228EAD|nr:putative ADP-ribosylation factor-like protein 5C isoform X3 [Myodes glareolus]